MSPQAPTSPGASHSRTAPTRRTSTMTPASSSAATSGIARRTSTAIVNGNGGQAEDTDGLVMREKASGTGESGSVAPGEREKGAGSVGKAGGREVTLTRPKRRLSSLPSLPHPFLSNTSHRALSAASSPPTSPNGAGYPTYDALQIQQQHPHQHPHQQTRGITSSLQGYQSTYSRSPTRIDEKMSNASGPYLPTATQREKDGPPMFCGIELKWISLITLALQNAFLTIIMHYSRISTAPNKTYSAAAAVLLNELLKGSISVIIALKRIDDTLIAQPSVTWADKDGKERRNLTSTRMSLFHLSRLRTLTRAVFSPDCYKLSVPAILYVVQNNLQYVAASNLDVATFQVTYQMKILTTAFFSVILLGKRLSRAKWAALFMLAVGVGIVQLQTTAAPTGHVAASPAPGVKVGHGPAALRSEIPEPVEVFKRVMHPLRGFVAVTLACLTSGLAGVYFELILKSSSGSAPPPDLWVRNTQLSLFSLVPALVPVVFSTGTESQSWLEGVASKFSNFNGWAIGTVLTQTFGGLVTAIVIRYSDNIMKGFATSLSIIISFLASVALFSYPITFAFIVGAAIVLAATYLYNSPTALPDIPPTRAAVAVTPGSPIPTSAPILGEPQPPSRTSSVINLLGLGSSSRGGSRRPSATDLRSSFPLSLGGMTPNNGGVPQPSLSGRGSLSASAPGTPYLSSAYPSSTNVSDTAGRISPILPAWTPPPSNRTKPNLTVDTSST